MTIPKLSKSNFLNCYYNNDHDKKKEDTYKITDHICIDCFGRVLAKSESIEPSQVNRQTYICSNCGKTARGENSSVLCCCGAKTRQETKYGKPGHFIDAGIRCVKNTNITDNFNSVIIAKKVK